MTKTEIEYRKGVYFLWSADEKHTLLYCNRSLEQMKAFRDSYTETNSLDEARKAVLRKFDH